MVTDERHPGMLDVEILQFLNSDAEDKDFNKFLEDLVSYI